MSEFSKMSTEELVDMGYKHKAEMDAAELKLNPIKEELRERAKKSKSDYLIGNKHFANISPSTSTECDSEELHDLYSDIGREKDFFKAVKVLVGKAKADLGETMFSTVANTKTTPYKNVSFKKVVPKKYRK